LILKTKVKFKFTGKLPMIRPKVNKAKPVEVFWKRVGRRLEDDRSCMAAFLAFHSAEVLEGVKPANLITMHDRAHPCGRNLYRLWECYAAGLLAASGLQAQVLSDCGRRRLVLLYSPRLLESLLQKPNVRNFLHKAGYPPYDGAHQALATLTGRVRGADFPHEIGLFLGYPLKDVAGFMGWAAIPFSSNGPWRIYGEPSRSLGLANCHKDCRRRMAQRLDGGCDPTLCLCPGRSAESCPAAQVPAAVGA
jgi:hypothetical protein